MAYDGNSLREAAYELNLYVFSQAVSDAAIVDSVTGVASNPNQKRLAQASFRISKPSPGVHYKLFRVDWDGRLDGGSKSGYLKQRVKIYILGKQVGGQPLNNLAENKLFGNLYVNDPSIAVSRGLRLKTPVGIKAKIALNLASKELTYPDAATAIYVFKTLDAANYDKTRFIKGVFDNIYTRGQRVMACDIVMYADPLDIVVKDQQATFEYLSQIQVPRPTSMGGKLTNKNCKVYERNYDKTAEGFTERYEGGYFVSDQDFERIKKMPSFVWGRPLEAQLFLPDKDLSTALKAVLPVRISRILGLDDFKLQADAPNLVFESAPYSDCNLKNSVRYQSSAVKNGVKVPPLLISSQVTRYRSEKNHWNLGLALVNRKADQSQTALRQGAASYVCNYEGVQSWGDVRSRDITFSVLFGGAYGERSPLTTQNG